MVYTAIIYDEHKKEIWMNSYSSSSSRYNTMVKWNRASDVDAHDEWENRERERINFNGDDDEMTCLVSFKIEKERKRESWLLSIHASYISLNIVWFIPL